MKKLILLLAFAMLFALTACGDDEPSQQQSPPAQSLEGGESGEGRTVLQVGGMICRRCSTAIIREVSAIDGVTDVSVDLDGGTVTVTHEAEVCPEEIKNAIVLEGFTVS